MSNMESNSDGLGLCIIDETSFTSEEFDGVKLHYENTPTLLYKGPSFTFRSKHASSWKEAMELLCDCKIDSQDRILIVTGSGMPTNIGLDHYGLQQKTFVDSTKQILDYMLSKICNKIDIKSENPHWWGNFRWDFIYSYGSYHCAKFSCVNLSLFLLFFCFFFLFFCYFQF